MTHIYAEEHRGRYLLSAKGHAEGEDPKVCAGISAILYALAGLLDNTPEIQTQQAELKSGDAIFRFSGGLHAQTAYRMALIGLMQIAESYPGYMEIIKK